MRPAGNPADRFLGSDSGTVIGEHLVLAMAALEYEGALRRAMQRLKYGGAARLAGPLAIAALPVLARLLQVSGPAPLVPVPLHPHRLRARGYNQAQLLASALAHGSGLRSLDLLVRTHATERQHRLSRVARLHNLRNAFSMAAEARPPPVVIVVDDILTTSATLEACAGVLRSAGVHRVYGFAIAREV
ncbi:MAG: ComF family protein [Candidatus Limnocylindria bacterium]